MKTTSRIAAVLALPLFLFAPASAFAIADENVCTRSAAPPPYPDQYSGDPGVVSIQVFDIEHPLWCFSNAAVPPAGTWLVSARIEWEPSDDGERMVELRITDQLISNPTLNAIRDRRIAVGATEQTLTWFFDGDGRKMISLWVEQTNSEGRTLQVRKATIKIRRLP